MRAGVAVLFRVPGRSVAAPRRRRKATAAGAATARSSSQMAGTQCCQHPVPRKLRYSSEVTSLLSTFFMWRFGSHSELNVREPHVSRVPQELRDEIVQVFNILNANNFQHLCQTKLNTAPPEPAAVWSSDPRAGVILRDPHKTTSQETALTTGRARKTGATASKPVTVGE